jgi:drug/metabolite transporter (DMT)-like permease
MLMLTATFFWALGHPVGRIILRTVHPFQLGALNLSFGFAAVFFFLVLSGRVKTMAGLPKKEIAASLLLGVFGFFIYQVCTFSALARIPASVNAILVSTNPVFIALFSALILRERINLLRFIGILFALMGAVFVTFNKGFRLEGEINLVGCAFSLCAAFSFALYSVFGKRVLSKNEPLIVSTYALLSGAVLLMLLSGFSVGFTELSKAPNSTWVLIILLSLTMIGIAYPLWFTCLKRMAASHVSIYIFMTPVFAVILSLLILHERFSWLFWLGGGLVMTGIGITTLSAGKQGSASS